MRLVSIPANPVPEDVVVGAVTTRDGTPLRFARFAPPAGRKGTVVLLQGRAEYIEKYFETVRDLRARGFAVPPSTGAGRACPNAPSPTRIRATCAISLNTSPTSRR